MPPCTVIPVLAYDDVGEAIEWLCEAFGFRERRARILQFPTDYPYGERQYTAEDLAGHRWSFSQTIADVASEDWGGTSSRAGRPSGP